MTKKAKTGRRLTASEWAEAEALYKSGDWTLRALAERFGCRHETMGRHMKKHKVDKGADSERIRDEITNEVAKRQREFAALKAQRVVETKSESVQIITAIRRRVGIELQQAQKNKVEIGLREKNIKVLNMMIDTIKKCNDESYRLLDIPVGELSEDELPELGIAQLTDEDVETIRRQQKEEAELYGDD